MRRWAAAAVALLAGGACASVPRREVVTSVHVGGTESCVVATGGAAYCWGITLPVPARVVTPEPLRTLDPGVFQACGLSISNRLLCTPAVAGVTAGGPCRVWHCVVRHATAGDREFVSVSGGMSHACALTSDGRAWCLGYNCMGQLGNGARSISPGSCGPLLSTPQEVVGGHRFASISAGQMHTCGLTTSGEAWCWGYGQSGEIGSDSVMTYCSGKVDPNAPCSVDVPVRVEGGLRFRSVVAGVRITCGLSMDAAAYCWGSNYRCGLGYCGDNSPRPVRIALPSAVRQVAPGYWFACAILVDDRAFCWGDNVFGQLGSLVSADSTFCFTGGKCTPTPTEVSGNLRWRTLSAGELHACGVTREDEVYCWGSRRQGRLTADAGIEVCINTGRQWGDEPCSPNPRRIQLALPQGRPLPKDEARPQRR